MESRHKPDLEYPTSKHRRYAENVTVAVHQACYDGDSDRALELLEYGVFTGGYQDLDEYGNTSLIWACRHEMPKVVYILIASGNANPDAVNVAGSTALIWACVRGMSDIAVAIVATGKSVPNQINSYGYSAIQIARANEMHKLLEMLSMN